MYTILIALQRQSPNELSKINGHGRHTIPFLFQSSALSFFACVVLTSFEDVVAIIIAIEWKQQVALMNSLGGSVKLTTYKIVALRHPSLLRFCSLSHFVTPFL